MHAAGRVSGSGPHLDVHGPGLALYYWERGHLRTAPGCTQMWGWWGSETTRLDRPRPCTVPPPGPHESPHMPPPPRSPVGALPPGLCPLWDWGMGDWD